MATRGFGVFDDDIALTAAPDNDRFPFMKAREDIGILTGGIWRRAGVFYTFFGHGANLFKKAGECKGGGGESRRKRQRKKERVFCLKVGTRPRFGTVLPSFGLGRALFVPAGRPNGADDASVFPTELFFGGEPEFRLFFVEHGLGFRAGLLHSDLDDDGLGTRAVRFHALNGKLFVEPVQVSLGCVARFVFHK